MSEKYTCSEGHRFDNPSFEAELALCPACGTSVIYNTCTVFRDAGDDFADWPRELQKEAKRMIIANLEATYLGGFAMWCRERNLNETKIRSSAE